MDWFLQYWHLIGLAGALLLTLLVIRIFCGEEYCPYERRGEILTANERKFYFALQRAINDQYAIFAMVRIADLLKVQSGAAQRQAWQNRINSKHIDFVLCDRDSLEAVLAIEVDDRSHQRPERQRRDEFVNDAFHAAGLPLLRVPAQFNYGVRELRSKLQEQIPIATSDRVTMRRRRRNTSKPPA